MLAQQALGYDISECHFHVKKGSNAKHHCNKAGQVG
jgi:hypothetical protein